MTRARQRTAKYLLDLQDLLRDKSMLLIVLQDNPDPDALGAAAALRKIANTGGLQCSITCGGTVGRAENRALIRYLDLNLRPLRDIDFKRFDLVALVDTQPGTGNNSLPAGVRAHIVFDHHPARPETRLAEFHDVRSRYGATCTLLTEYLQEAGIEPDAPLATALLYGIRSDTQDLGRKSTHADMAAYEYLYPKANRRMLGNIQRGQVPTDYFRLLFIALDRARLCGTSIHCDLGAVDNPDMIAEVADLLLRHEEAAWSLVWGYHDTRVLLSVRTSAPAGEADAVAKRIVSGKGTGGGHHSMAGGQIPLPDATAATRRHLASLIRKRYFAATGNDGTAQRALI